MTSKLKNILKRTRLLNDCTTRERIICYEQVVSQLFAVCLKIKNDSNTGRIIAYHRQNWYLLFKKQMGKLVWLRNWNVIAVTSACSFPCSRYLWSASLWWLLRDVKNFLLGLKFWGYILEIANKFLKH